MADQLLDTLTEQVVTRIVEVLSPLKNEYEPTTLTVGKAALARWLHVDKSNIDSYMKEEYLKNHVVQLNFAGEDTRFYVDEVCPWLLQRPTSITK